MTGTFCSWLLCHIARGTHVKRQYAWPVFCGWLQGPVVRGTHIRRQYEWPVFCWLLGPVARGTHIRSNSMAGFSVDVLMPTRMLLHNVKQHNVNVTWCNVTKRSCTQRKSSKTWSFQNVNVTLRTASQNIYRYKTFCNAYIMCTYRFLTLYVLRRCTLSDIHVLTLLCFVCLRCVQLC